MLKTLVCLLVALTGVAVRADSAPGSAPDYDAMAAAARETLRALIEADTTNPPGNEERAVEIVARKLDDAGIAYEVTEFGPHRKNLVARLKGTGPEGPVLLIGHSDVVGASGQAWTVEPHKLTEKDGYLYGRGTGDMLGMVAVNLETFLMFKRSGAPLKRDLVFAVTGDEESGGAGVQYILRNHPEQLRAAIALNETGGPIVMDSAAGKVSFVGIQAAEKTYQDYRLIAKGKTGHSSVPLADNAIYKLSAALERVGRFRFPARLLDVTRGSFEARAASQSPKIAAAMRALARSSRKGGTLPAAAVKALESDPIINAELRTTCVATLVSGGTRVNALPAEATANVNCRILPDETPGDVQKTLARVIGDSSIAIEASNDFGNSQPSPLVSPDLDRVRHVIREMWPAAVIGPILSRGATDCRFLRRAGIASYGMNPLPMSEEDRRRAHGIDERIPAASLRQGVEFLHRVVTELESARAL